MRGFYGTGVLGVLKGSGFLVWFSVRGSPPFAAARGFCEGTARDASQNRRFSRSPQIPSSFLSKTTVRPMQLCSAWQASRGSRTWTVTGCRLKCGDRCCGWSEPDPHARTIDFQIRSVIQPAAPRNVAEDSPVSLQTRCTSSRRMQKDRSTKRAITSTMDASRSPLRRRYAARPTFDRSRDRRDQRMDAVPGISRRAPVLRRSPREAVGRWRYSGQRLRGRRAARTHEA